MKCLKVEVDVLGSMSLLVRTVAAMPDVKQDYLEEEKVWVAI